MNAHCDFNCAEKLFTASLYLIITYVARFRKHLDGFMVWMVVVPKFLYAWINSALWCSLRDFPNPLSHMHTCIHTYTCTAHAYTYKHTHSLSLSLSLFLFQICITITKCSPTWSVPTATTSLPSKGCKRAWAVTSVPTSPVPMPSPSREWTSVLSVRMGCLSWNLASRRVDPHQSGRSPAITPGNRTGLW